MDDAETFGQLLHRLRGDISLREIARRSNVSPTYVFEVEKDRKTPSEKVAAALDTALNADGKLVTALHSRPVKQIGLHSPAEPKSPIDEQTDDKEDTTKRRRLLQLAAGVGAGTLGMHESARQLLDLSLNTHRSIEDWDLTITDHLHALRTLPPHQVAHDLTVDLLALHAQIDHPHPADETRELYRVAAVLACVQANALTRIGDHGAAIRWWYTARTAADTAKDLHVRLLVRGEEAIHGLYGQRAPDTVLTLIHKARHITPRPWPRLVAAEAKTLAMLGRHHEAVTALHHLLDLTEHGISGDTLGWWKPDQIPFAHSWVYATAGNETAADAARDHVLNITPEHSYQYRINVRLHEAICTVAQGGTTAGARQATQLITSLPSVYRTNHVLETGRRVLRLVPLDQRKHPAASDLRAVLTAAV